MDTVAWLRPARLFVVGGLLIAAAAVASFWMNRQFFGTNFSSDDGDEYGLYIAVGTTLSETLRLLGIGVVLLGLARLVFPAVPAVLGEAPVDPSAESTEESDGSDGEAAPGTGSRSAPESLEIGGSVVDPPAPDDPVADRLWSRHGS